MIAETTMWLTSAAALVAELEEIWLAALKEQDVQTLGELLHEQFTSTSARSMGEVIDKQEYLSAATEVEVCDYHIRTNCFQRSAMLWS